MVSASYTKLDFGELFLAFILVIIGIGMTPQMSSSCKQIEEDNNSSDVLKLIAPYGAVLWFVAIGIGIPAALVYDVMHRNK